MGTQAQGMAGGRGGEGWEGEGSSRFSVHSSQFTIHDSQFTVHGSRREGGEVELGARERDVGRREGAQR